MEIPPMYIYMSHPSLWNLSADSLIFLVDQHFYEAEPSSDYYYEDTDSDFDSQCKHR